MFMHTTYLKKKNKQKDAKNLRKQKLEKQKAIK